VSNTNNNYQAAGTAATTARGTVKESWYKRPGFLNFVIAAGVIAIALIINANYQFNFFWKLLVGMALIWGGGMLADTKIGPATLWGNILKGIGWLVLVIALLGSGIRHFSEGVVNWVDARLGSAWSENHGVPGTSESYSATGPMVVTFVLRELGVHETKEVDRTGRMEIFFQPPAGAIWYACGRVVGPLIVRSHAEKPALEMKFTAFKPPPGWHYYEFSNELVSFLKENDVRTPLMVEFTLREAIKGVAPATCPR